jgi:hypothetical protein
LSNVAGLSGADEFYTRERELLGRLGIEPDSPTLDERFKSLLPAFVSRAVGTANPPDEPSSESKRESAREIFWRRFPVRPSFSPDLFRLAMWQAGWHLSSVQLKPNYRESLDYVIVPGRPHGLCLRTPDKHDSVTFPRIIAAKPQSSPEDSTFIRSTNSNVRRARSATPAPSRSGYRASRPHRRR